LMDTPPQIIEDEIRRAHWKACLIEEDLDLRQAVIDTHTFSHIPNELRIKRFTVELLESDIDKVKNKIEHAREYYDSLRKIFV
jgi:hypothetical protein